MNLIIDIGNTFTKIALVDKGYIVDVNRYEKVTGDLLDQILKKHSALRAIISAVGHFDDEVFKEVIQTIPVLRFDQSTNVPIKNFYQTPQTLGLDRLAGVIGASFLHPQNDLLVIDCGTAITYDFINKKMEYLGGAISPGISTRFKSLHTNTAKLPELRIESNYPLLAANTKDCILSGVLNGVVAEVDNYISEIRKIYPESKILITGGDANFFVDKLKNSIFVVQNLVIIGLNRILEFNA